MDSIRMGEIQRGTFLSLKSDTSFDFCYAFVLRTISSIIWLYNYDYQSHHYFSNTMDFVHKELLADHQRWVDEVSDESALFSECKICIVDVLDAHYSIVDYFLERGKDEKKVGGIGPRDKGLLSSAVARQTVGYRGNVKWETDYEKCATLFYGLIKNHPFHDCNKRTALLTALYYLAKISRTPTVRHKELEKITLLIASNKIRSAKRFRQYKKRKDGEVHFLARYFQKNTRPIDKRYYVITYNELNRILGNFGFYLNNPHGNAIDVMRIGKKTSFFGLLKSAEEHYRVGVIGFPGWTREVPRKEMKLLREITGLTVKDGFDSQVVYKGAQSLTSLINEFSGILQRLASK